MISLRVTGTPGPKGSMNAFCVRCAARRLKQSVAIKEQSENGVAFRKLLAAELRKLSAAGTHHPGPVRTDLTVYVPRTRRVKAGVELDEWIPSHQTPYPIDRQTGDAEKHVRNFHDALMDAGILADDSQVVDQSSRKVWADEAHPAGVDIEVVFL